MTQLDAARKEQGAKISQLGLSEQLLAYAKDHERVAKESFIRLIKQPLNTMITWLVIGIALSLPVGFYVGLANLQSLGEHWDGNTQISLFLRETDSPEEIDAFAEALKKWPEIKSLTVISKEQALEEFKATSGFSETLDSLKQNPLPVVFEIVPAEASEEQIEAEKLLNRLQVLPLVDMAQMDLQWVKRLQAILQIGQHIALLLIVLLSTGVVVIIGNTIRLDIDNRQKEIIVVKLIGGTDAFIRRPFLYSGFYYGSGGGIFASIIVFGALLSLNKPIANLAGLYQVEYQLAGVSLLDTLSLWILAGLLGFFGAWFSVGKHLDGLEPQ